MTSWAQELATVIDIYKITKRAVAGNRPHGVPGAAADYSPSIPPCPQCPSSSAGHSSPWRRPPAAYRRYYHLRDPLSPGRLKLMAVETLIIQADPGVGR